jgi:hypothetical protein
VTSLAPGKSGYADVAYRIGTSGRTAKSLSVWDADDSLSDAQGTPTC